MEVILLVSVFLLDACSVSCEPLGLSEDSKALDDTLHILDSGVYQDYNPLGCYDFQTLKNQSVLGRRKRSVASFEECFQKAHMGNFFLFGIKNTTKDGRLHCVKGNEKAWDKKDNFTKVNSCEKDTGSPSSVFMYRKTKGIQGQCIYKNKSYSDYEEISLFNATNMNDFFCTSCTCRRGKFRDCISQSCHLGHCTSDDGYFPPDACCPWCMPPSGSDACNLKGKKPGDEFEEDNPEGTARYHCHCKTGNYVYCSKSFITGWHNTTKALSSSPSPSQSP